MFRKPKKNLPFPKKLPALTAPRDQLERELSAQITKGEALLTERDSLYGSDEGPVWSDYNRTLLESRFSTKDIADYYASRTSARFPRGGARIVEEGLVCLKRILTFMPLYPDQPTSR
jgi:hypothetical protein